MEKKGLGVELGVAASCLVRSAFTHGASLLLWEGEGRPKGLQTGVPCQEWCEEKMSLGLLAE